MIENLIVQIEKKNVHFITISVKNVFHRDNEAVWGYNVGNNHIKMSIIRGFFNTENSGFERFIEF